MIYFDNSYIYITFLHTVSINISMIHVAQGSFEFGIFNTYFEVGKYPMFSREKMKGSSICFTVP